MPVRIWVQRILGTALALLICAGLWWLRPAQADPVALQVIDTAAPGEVPAPTADGSGAEESPGADSDDGGASPEDAPADDSAESQDGEDGTAPTLEVAQNRTLLQLRPTSADPTKGFVFYPGALVDPRAYAAILAPIAEAGYLVGIVKSPFDLPLADITAAHGVIEANPDVGWWAIGGHSLGGVAASSYTAGSSDADALVLWASYPYLDLSDLIDLPVLSVSGSNDGLTTPAEVASAAGDLPPGTEYVEVPGAVHAFFGDYGEQAGDGVPQATRQEAQQVIVDTTLTWLNSQSASP